MNTIQSEWESFRVKVIPKNAPVIQVFEMKKAFYAGAYSTISTMLRIGCDDISDEAGAEIFETIKNECETFGINGGV